MTNPTVITVDAPIAVDSGNTVDQLSQIVPLASGGFMVIWDSGNSNLDLMGRSYDANGNPTGGTVQLATGATAIAGAVGLANGNFVVVYQGATAGGIQGQVFTANGTPVGSGVSPFPVVNENTSISALKNGGFVVAYAGIDSSLGNAIFNVYTQAYDALGNKVGPAIRVNATSYNGGGYTSRDLQPQIVSLTNGGYVVAWYSDDGGGQVFAQQFDASGARIGAEIATGVGTVGDSPSVAALADGGFVIGWNPAGGFSQAQIFDASSRPIGNPIDVSEAVVGGTASGGFIAQNGPDLQFYNSEGTATSALLDNDTVRGTVAGLSNGQLVATSLSTGESVTAVIITPSTASTLNPELPPTVTATSLTTAQGNSLAPDSSVALADLITTADPDGNGEGITEYEFTDTTAGTGASFIVSGNPIAAGQTIDLTPAQFASAQFQVGSEASDNLTIRVFNGQAWSDPATAIIETVERPTNSPFLGTGNETLAVGQQIPIAALFNVGGGAVYDYRFIDTTTDPSSGSLLVDGVAQLPNEVVQVDPDQLQSVSFVNGTDPTTLSISIFNGTSWQTPQTVTISQLVLPSPALSTSFSGVDFDAVTSLTDYEFIPPDASGAVGPNNVIEVTNGSIEWYSKSGTLQDSQSLFSFFGQSGPTLTDPRVIYDATAGRFVVAAISAPGSGVGPELVLAESKDSNPNDGWIYQTHAFSGTIAGQSLIPDYTSLASNGSSVFVGVNLFGATSLSEVGSEVLTYSFSTLATEAGTAAKPATDAGVIVSDPAKAAGLSTDLDTTMPAKMLSLPTGTTQEFLVSYSGIHAGADSIVTVLTESSGSNPTFAATQFDVGNIDSYTSSSTSDMSAPQPGGNVAIDANDDRITDAVYSNGYLYAVANVIPTSGDDAGVPTVHWWEFNATNPSDITLVDQGNVDGNAISPGAATFDGSISVDSNGDFLINFSASGPSLDPGSYYVLHRIGDPASTVETPVALAAGQSTYVRTFGSGENRWGDNSGVAIDPSSPDTFWLFNEYAETQGSTDPDTGESGRWGTEIGSVVVPNTANFSSDTSGVTADLATGVAVDGSGTTTSLQGMENIVGSPFASTLIGDANNNALTGGAGNDTMIGGGGDNTLNGGGGINTVDYSSAPAAVNVNLATGLVSNNGYGGIDTLSNIQSVIGTPFNDTFTVLASGLTSATTITGGGGSDTLDIASAGTVGAS
jgi:hypothetical protein